MKHCTTFFHMILCVSSLFIWSCDYEIRGNPYEKAYSLITEKGSLENEVCVDELLIYPLFEQFRIELKGELESWNYDVSKEDKIFLEESDGEVFIRNERIRFKYDYKEYRHREISPCLFQEKTVFFSNLSNRSLYMLLVDSGDIISRNSEVVTFKGEADAFLIYFDRRKENIIGFISKKVHSFIPPPNR